MMYYFFFKTGPFRKGGVQSPSHSEFLMVNVHVWQLLKERTETSEAPDI